MARYFLISDESETFVITDICSFLQIVLAALSRGWSSREEALSSFGSCKASFLPPFVHFTSG
jgi:hypothetical protein